MKLKKQLDVDSLSTRFIQMTKKNKVDAAMLPVVSVVGVSSTGDNVLLSADTPRQLFGQDINLAEVATDYWTQKWELESLIRGLDCSYEYIQN